MAESKTPKSPRNPSAPRFAGAHTAYRVTPFAAGTSSSDDVVRLSDVRTFSSERAAMLFALEAEPPMRYVFWPFGMSLADAIVKRESERAAEKSADS